MSELRDWMHKNFSALRDDRDTESYALEFLRTERSNYENFRRRSSACLKGRAIRMNAVRDAQEKESHWREAYNFLVQASGLHVVWGNAEDSPKIQPLKCSKCGTVLSVTE